ncbi:hypothetical protein [Francisella adeliensis]|uniref:hypothetical protein n=1 Tax=Francisella adeliensis TaxID=2007306 RepID=UPI001F1F0ADD|nr:hypothetical protein [Francisella adeliensis]
MVINDITGLMDKLTPTRFTRVCTETGIVKDRKPSSKLYMINEYTVCRGIFRTVFTCLYNIVIYKNIKTFILD